MRDPLTEERRPWGRYLTPTLLKGFLAGDHVCEWKLWVFANFKFEKREEDAASAARLVQWNKDHNRMVKARAAKLREEGFMVRVEHSLKLKFPDKTVISGTMDILATLNEFIHIWDGKTGRRRDADHQQVRIYLALLQRTTKFNRPLFEDEPNEWQGFVEYRASVEDVFPADEDYSRIVDLVKRAGVKDPPARTPSQHECRYCKIANCPDREEVVSGEGGWT